MITDGYQHLKIDININCLCNPSPTSVLHRPFSTVSGALIQRQSEMQIAVLEMTVRKPSFDNFNNANTEYTAAYLGLIFFFDREFELRTRLFNLQVRV